MFNRLLLPKITQTPKPMKITIDDLKIGQDIQFDYCNQVVKAQLKYAGTHSLLVKLTHPLLINNILWSKDDVKFIKLEDIINLQIIERWR